VTVRHGYHVPAERAVSCELTLQDYFGRTVTLEHENWEKHKDRHPTVVAHHGDLAMVLQDPDHVLEQANGQWHFYRRGILQGIEAHCYLKVVIEDFGVAGWKIKTAFPIATVRPKGIRRWSR
jgi:hypothetical protein